MLKQQNHWLRMWRAFACLLAVLLLQAPFARAAWIAVSAECCLSDHCPVPGHHHKTQPAKEEMPMDCGHGTHKMVDCKISCCESMDENAISIALFVMPVVRSIAISQSTSPQVLRHVPQMISRSEKPQPPPPKSFLW